MKTLINYVNYASQSEISSIDFRDSLSVFIEENITDYLRLIWELGIYRVFIIRIYLIQTYVFSYRKICQPFKAILRLLKIQKIMSLSTRLRRKTVFSIKYYLKRRLETVRYKNNIIHYNLKN